MLRRTKTLSVIVAALLATACNESTDPGSFHLRVLHASPDAPKVNVLVNGSAVLQDVDYKQGSGFLTKNAGTYDIAVEGILPGGNQTVINLPGTAFAGNTNYTVIAVGAVAGIQALPVSSPDTPVTSGKLRVQVVHAAPGAPPVDVYVTAPGAPLNAAGLLGNFAFKGSLGPQEIPAGSYEIRVTLANLPTQVVFDSGTLSLSAGADLLLAAVQRTGAGTAPISLVVLDGVGSAEILDTATPADLRVVHASPDAPNVDVIVNDNLASPLVTNLAYAAAAPSANTYLAVPAATYNVKVVDSPTQTVTALNFSADLAAGNQYTVLATGLLAGIQQLVLTDDNRSVATEAKVRIVHGSPAAGNVDIYVVAAGSDIGSQNPAFGNVPFRANTGYVGLAAGTYDVKVTPAGQKAPVAIAATGITFASGDVYTAVARDAANGGAPLGLILLDDF